MAGTFASAVSLVVVVLVVTSGTPIQAKNHPQQLFVTVLDRTGTPVRDLTASDFQVSEGGKRREVTRVAQAAGFRSRIAVLVDNGFLSGSTIIPMRTALESLLADIPAEDDVVLGTISPQFRIKVKPTADRRELRAGVNTLFASTATGTALVDGLMEVDERFVKNARDRWPVFVVITSDSPEVSGRQLEDFNRWIQELVSRGGRAYAIVIAYGSTARGNEPEMCMALTKSTGGTYERIAALTGLPGKVKAISAAITSVKVRAADEYVVEFTRETDNSPIDVSVPVPGVTVSVSLAP